MPLVAIPGFGEVLTIVVSAFALRAVVVLAVTARTDDLRHETRLAEQRAAQLGVLQAASGRLSRAGTVEAVGRAIVEETRRIIDYHNARVYVLEPGGDVIPIAFEGMVGAYEQVDFELLRCRVGEGFTGWVAEHGVPILVGDANLDPRGATIPGTDDVDESMLVVPMAYDGVTVGVITLSKLGIDQFDAEDERLLLILADQAATAIETARHLARSQALAGELRRLLDMGGELSASLDSRQVANLIARHLASAMGVDECAISYWDRPAGRLVTLGYHPPTPVEELQPYFELAGYPESRRVLEHQETSVVRCGDPAADPAELALLEPAGYRSLVMLPLVAKGESIGLVELMARTPVAISADNLELARTMANEAAIALENARLYEEARALADRDPLTGFYNHRYLHERFGEEVVRAQRSRSPLSVLMLDLDDFKLVNDTFGHLFGDGVLALDGRADPLDAPGVGHPGPLRRRRVRDPPARHGPRGGRRSPPSGSGRRSPRRRSARRAERGPGVARRRRRDVPGRRPERGRADRRRRRAAVRREARAGGPRRAATRHAGALTASRPTAPEAAARRGRTALLNRSG